jgi:integrase
MGRSSSSGARFLVQRSDKYGIWQYYRKVASDIAPKVIGEVKLYWSGKTARLEAKPLIAISLSTLDRREAITRRDMIHHQIEEIVAEAIRTVRKPGLPKPRLVAGLSDAQRQSVAAHIHGAALSAMDTEIVGGEVDRMAQAQPMARVIAAAAKDQSESDAVSALMTENYHYYWGPFGEEDKTMRPVVDQILRELGIEMIAEDQRRLAALAIVRAARRAVHDLEKRQRGEVVETPLVHRPILDEKAEQGPTVREVFEQFAGTLENPRTAQDYRVHITRFTEIMGDVPVKRLTRKMVFDFATQMQRFPVRYPDAWRSRPANEIIELASKTPGQKMMSKETINDKALAALSSTMTHALKHDLITANPCAGVALPKSKTAAKPRIKFEIEHLQAIFSQPEFVGQPKGAFFWLPIFALYTGARLEEIGQLRCSDIRQYNRNFWYISFTADGQKTRLKTRSSERDVPIHRDIIDKGLLEQRDSSSRMGEWLFPELIPNRHGTRTAAFSKRWGKFFDRIGLDDDRLAFHSFRHTFLRKCRDSRIPKDVAEHLSGHAEADVSSGYGAGYDLETLNDWIQRIDWSEAFGKEVPSD